MPDDREIAREILSGQVTLDQASKLRHSSPQSTSAPTNHPATAAPPIQPGAVPENKAPTLTNAPPVNRQFPCKNCGARLDFDPTQRALACPYCGHVEQIAPAKIGSALEHDYAAALANLEKNQDAQASIDGRSKEIRCPTCGANVLLEDNVEAENCPFCAAHLANAPRTDAREMILPESLLPFRIAQRDAVVAFNKWIAALWFAPNDLKKMANLGQLSGVYLPFWTYDSMTYSHYTGQRGDDYWETEYYTDSQGHSQSRQVRRTRWSYVSGEVDHFFDDVLVCASHSLPVNDVNHLEPWDLKDLDAFDPQFLAGFKTERYVVTLPEGFTTAQQIMDAQIRKLICRDIGGDHQQISSVQTQHVGVTFKQILLPLWLAVYLYAGKTYRILVNARTADVTGTRPYSTLKIALAILAGVAVLIIILVIYANSR